MVSRVPEWENLRLSGHDHRSTHLVQGAQYGSLRPVLGNRQRHGERRSFPYPALQPNRAAVHLDNLSGDRETQSAAFARALARLVSFVEALEDSESIFLGNPNAGIRYL